MGRVNDGKQSPLPVFLSVLFPYKLDLNHGRKRTCEREDQELE